jgi:hypothetical protein
VSDDARIAAIEAWFLAGGLRLAVEPNPATGWLVYVTAGDAQLSISGAKTRLAAAEEALSAFQKLRSMMDADRALVLADLREVSSDFVDAFASLTGGLTDVLEGPPLEGSLLATLVSNIWELHIAGRISERDFESARLSFLTKHLREVGERDLALRRSFVRRLESSNDSTYYGARQEILVAASLMRKVYVFDFEPPGGPDFNVRTGLGVIGIECTSAHIPAEWDSLFVVDPRPQTDARDVTYKLLRAIRAKARKPYASGNVVLAIDATNIYAHSSDDLTYDEVSEALKTTPYGAAVFFALSENRDVERLPGEFCLSRGTNV